MISVPATNIGHVDWCDAGRHPFQSLFIPPLTFVPLSSTGTTLYYATLLSVLIEWLVSRHHVVATTVLYYSRGLMFDYRESYP